MNILQILPELNVGGVETGTVDLAKSLTLRGHRCVVVSGGGELVGQIEAMGVRHITLPVDNKAFWVMLGAAKKIARIIKEENIEIVHARSRVPAWVGFMAARRTDAIFITTAHGHYSRHIFSYMMGWGKFTIVPSSVIGKRMAEEFGVPRSNIRLIPRSVDLERYAFRGFKERSGKEFLIGVIGRIAPIKGQLYFLKALALVLRSYPFARALIVGGVSPGKDHYMEELEVWTRRLGLTDTVTFTGNRRDIPDILSGLDCLVMPSISEESFGRVIVEAQAIGVPVVATKVGGVVEIIDDGIDGLLVHPRDHEGLSEALLKVIQDEALARRLVADGRRKVETKFTLEAMTDATLKVYEEARQDPRILVFKISAVGDAILSIPSFEAIKKKFPTSHVTCCVGKDAREAFIRCPYIDELIVCDFKGKDSGLRGLVRLGVKLMRRRFDFCIDFQNNKKTHFLSYMTFSSRRYGYANGKGSFFLNRKVKDNGAPMDPVAHQFRVLDLLGVPYNGEALALWPSAEDKAFADTFLRSQGAAEGTRIGVNIGASPRWSSKRWPVKRFVALCDALAKKGYRVVLTGGNADAAVARKILEGTRSQPACAVARTSLMQLAALVDRCDAYVTGDSAPMHVAAAMGTPFVALFGPTDARRHLPPSEEHIVLQKNCPPCYKDQCPKPRHKCMEDITVEEVMGAMERLLCDRGGKPIPRLRAGNDTADV